VPRRHIQENDGDGGTFLIWQELGLTLAAPVLFCCSRVNPAPSAFRSVAAARFAAQLFGAWRI
jgi:hypothetical protein